MRSILGIVFSLWAVSVTSSGPYMGKIAVSGADDAKLQSKVVHHAAWQGIIAEEETDSESKSKSDSASPDSFTLTPYSPEQVGTISENTTLQTQSTLDIFSLYNQFF